MTVTEKGEPSRLAWLKPFSLHQITNGATHPSTLLFDNVYVNPWWGWLKRN